MEVVVQGLTGTINNLVLLSVPGFIFAGSVMGRGGMATRLINWISCVSRPRARRHGAHHDQRGRAVRRDLRLERGDRGGARQRALPGAAAARLRRALLARADHLVGCDRHHHPAEHHHDPVLGDDQCLGRQAVPRRASCPASWSASAPAVYCVWYAMRHKITVGPRDGDVDGDAAHLARGDLDAGRARSSSSAASTAASRRRPRPPWWCRSTRCIVSVFIYRELTWRDVWAITRETAQLSAKLFIIVAAAGVFSWMLAAEGVPQTMVGFIDGLRPAPVDGAAARST